LRPVVFGGGKKFANELPLPLVEFVPFYHKGSIAAERLVGVLRQALVARLSDTVCYAAKWLKSSKGKFREFIF
jgi:hypothetical protein